MSSKTVSDSKLGYAYPLVQINRDGEPSSIYALVSHSELDGLIGRLMQMCELTGDTEQRKALKGEIKERTRTWLDNVYASAGYDKWNGVEPDAQVHVIEAN